MGFWQALGAFTEGMFDGASGQVTGRRQGRGRIARLCRALDWSVNEIEGEVEKLHFRDAQAVDGVRKICIYGGDTDLVLFSVISHAILPEEQVPEEVLGYLLLRNHEQSVGHWGVGLSDNQVVFMLKYVAFGEALVPLALKFICDQLLKEASAFDARMRSAGLLRS